MSLFFDKFLNKLWQGQPRRWAFLVLMALIGAVLGAVLITAVVPARYTSTELVRLYNKAEEKLAYAPVLTVDEIFIRNTTLDSLITPARLHEAIGLLPDQFPQFGLTAAQIEPNVQTQVVRDTVFIEIKVEAESEQAAEYLAGGIGANLLLLQIERHEPLNLRLETTAHVSTHRLTPTEPFFALPLALLITLILSSLAAKGLLQSNLSWLRRVPFGLKFGVMGLLGLASGLAAGLFMPLAFVMLAAIAVVVGLALVRFEWGLFGLLALLPFHNLFRAYTAQAPWKFVRLLDYWQQGVLLLILVAMFWQLRHKFLVKKFWRNPFRNMWRNLLLHEKVLAIFGALGLIYVWVAPKLVVGVSGLIEDYACFGVYLVARQVGQSRRSGQNFVNTSQKMLGGLVWVVAAGGIVAVMTIVQYLITGTAAWLIWTGYAVGTPDFNTLTANYLYGTIDTKPVYRAVSTLMNPLLLSFYAVTVSTLALTLFVFWRKLSYKLWTLAVAAGLLNALLLSYTRSAWIGAALAVAALAGLAVFKRLRPTPGKNLLLYGLVIAAVVACDFIPWNSLPLPFISGDNGLSQAGGVFGSISSYTSATLKGRDGTSDYHVKSLLDIGVNQLLLKHPLGAGLGMEGTVANHYIADGTIKNPLPWVESYYFVIAGQLGVFGLLLFLALLATTAWDLWQQWRRSNLANQMWQTVLSVAGLTTLLGVGVASITLPNWSDSAISWTLWAIIGLAFSPAAHASVQTQATSPTSPFVTKPNAVEVTPKKVLA